MSEPLFGKEEIVLDIPATPAGQVHVCVMPEAWNIPNGHVWECDGCDNRYMVVPQGIIGKGWQPLGELKTEQEVQNKPEPVASTPATLDPGVDAVEHKVDE